jgi:hypothetical protein
VFAGKDIENPEVAIDDAGIAFMVWTKAPLLEAWVTRYTPGGGWGTATLIGSGNIVSDWARIAVSTSGNAMVLWNASDNRPPRCSYYTVGKGWSPSMVVGSADGDTRSGALSLDDQGNALVAWEQAQSGSPTDHAIWANRYAPDTGWDMAAPIETAGSYAVMPLVAFDRHGNAAVVWAEDGESYSGVLANRYSVGVGWGTEALIGASKPPERQAIEPDVAMGGKGNIVVVWYQGDAGYQRVFANRYTAANGWETPTPISPAGMFDSHHPKVTVSTAGDAIAVWVQTSSDLSHSEIWSNRYEVGSGWGAATAIGSDAGDQSWVDVAGDAEGNALAIWNDGGQFRLERYTSAQGWNEPISLGPSGAIYPGLAVSPAGHAIAIWATGNLEKYTLWARRFELGEASH